MNTLLDQDESQPLKTSVAQVVQYLPLIAEIADPPPECKTELFQKIRRQNQEVSRHRVLLPQTGFDFIPDHDTDGWLEHFDPGVQVKTLAKNPTNNYSVLLMKLAPGAILHEHHHSGSEQCYVLEGSVLVQGNALYAGDFHQAAANSTHNTIISHTGAKLLLVVGMDDYKKAYWRVLGTSFGTLITRFKNYATGLLLRNNGK